MAMVKFQFRRIPSDIFGVIYRPYADVLLQNKQDKSWLKVTMVVDTGADYTILPISYADYLGIDVKKDCLAQITHGIGGSETIYLYKSLSVKIGDFYRKIPVGFLNRNDIPPLMGRHQFFETFKAVFDKRVVFFE